MTYKEVVKVTFSPYENNVLTHAYDFACKNLEKNIPKELYELLTKLRYVTSTLMKMSADD